MNIFFTFQEIELLRKAIQTMIEVSIDNNETQEAGEYAHIYAKTEGLQLESA